MRFTVGWVRRVPHWRARLNLFEIIDGFFEGIAFFGYNAFWAALLDIWPYLAAAGFVTIAIDASLRAILLVRFRRNRRRRRAVFAVVEYRQRGHGSPHLSRLSSQISWNQPTPSWSGDLDFYLIVGSLLIAAFFYGVAAPALLLARGLTGKRILTRQTPRRFVAGLATAAACAVLIPAGIFVILSGARTIFTSIVSARAEETAHPQIAVAGLQCVQTQDGLLVVGVAFGNPIDKPLSFRGGEVDLVLGYLGTGSPHDTFLYNDDRVHFMRGNGSDLKVINAHDVLTLEALQSVLGGRCSLTTFAPFVSSIPSCG